MAQIGKGKIALFTYTIVSIETPPKKIYKKKSTSTNR